MKILIKLLVIAIVFLTVSSARAETSKDIEDWYRGYAAHWLNADVDVKAVSTYYASPFYYLGATGPALDTSESINDSLTSYAEAWKKDGWSGARLLDVKAKILNESSAMILTEWDIHAMDGSSIIGCARAPWTYLATKTKDGWKLALEIEIGCGQGLVFD